MDLSLVLCVTMALSFVMMLRRLNYPQRLITLPSLKSKTSWSFVVASAPLQRFVGLLNHASLADRTGLLITKTRSVHTRGMQFPLDLIGIDKQGAVTAIREHQEPGLRQVKFPATTVAVLEITSGQAELLLRECGYDLKDLLKR